MATIWLVKSGETQKGPPAGEKPLDWCVMNLELRRDHWIRGLDTRKLTIGEKENPQLASYRGFRHAVVQLDEAEVAGRVGWKAGYYLLDKDATQVSKVFDAS
jgi:hypothetical protein